VNKRAEAYLAKYGVFQIINDVPELMIPLERLQGFLDLLGPADVPPENLQKLYAFQATAVQIVQAQLAPWLGANDKNR
jgi:hypothetical protein